MHSLNRSLPSNPVHLTALKNWHQGSAILDSNGDPLVAYHGTYVRTGKSGEDLMGNIFSFDRNMSVSTVRRAPSIDNVGIWFSDNPGEGGAQMYGNTIYPVYLRITRPKYFESFAEMLSAFHKAAGTQNTGNGLGDPEPLRQQLKSQGFDGICLARSNTGELLAECEEFAQAIHKAKNEVYCAPSEERSFYLAKVDRLKETYQRLRTELKQYGESTEFDNQLAIIAFEPEQIKSAVGCDMRYDRASPLLTGLCEQAQELQIADYCEGLRQRRLDRKAHALQQQWQAIGSMDDALEAFSLQLSKLEDSSLQECRAWLDYTFCSSNDPFTPFMAVAERMARSIQATASATGSQLDTVVAQPTQVARQRSADACEPGN